MTLRLPHRLMHRLTRWPLLASALLALAGCQTMQPAKVDFPDPALTRPVAVAPQPVALAPASGSLYQRASYRPHFEDRRARLVGDTLTVQIVENLSASQNSKSTLDKSGSISSAISAFPFLSAKQLGKLNLGAGSDNTFAGAGGTSSNNTFISTITVTVVDVLPNGHLQVRGDKQIGVNENVDVLRFSGTVDPRSVQPGSVVPSTAVANVRVQSRGRGQQQDAQVIGWLARFFLSVLPF